MAGEDRVAVERRTAPEVPTVVADVCVVGAGMSGVTCAIMLARRGRQVVLVDACPWLGGQAIGVPIGTIGGLFSSGPEPYLLTPIFARELLQALTDADACYLQRSRRARTVNVVYDDVALMRIFERMVRKAGVRTILGGIASSALVEGRHLRAVRVETRFGPCEVRAKAFVDTSGDAALTWLAGLSCRRATFPIYGTQMCILEGVEYGDAARAHEVAFEAERLFREKGSAYGLTRHEGVIFPLPSRGMAVLNVTHVATPLDPVRFWEEASVGREEAERGVALLKTEYPQVFGRAHIRSLGYPGIRQTRTIVGAYMLTVDDVREGRRFPDAIARVAWPIELHDTAAGFRWEPFPDGHLHYIPLRALLHAEADNLIAAGRCVDADPLALSSIRLMGPCIAMAVAAAETIDLFLAGADSLHNVDVALVQERVRPNLEGMVYWPPQGVAAAHDRGRAAE
ncbi:MAG TPA: FAD-dependent oxidoreductase [Chloroflexota bacterium]|nr:FAD-dependent oxidoreductase [Chloroflexota bacterium]